MTADRKAQPSARSVPLLAVILLFFLSGAAGLVYEVIWLRSLTLVFGKTVHAASAVLAAFMAGLAAGSVGGGRLVDRLRWSPLKIYAFMELGIAGWALLLPLVFRGVEGLYAMLAGSVEQPGMLLGMTRFALATLAMMPATAMMGATLPALSRWAVHHETEVGSRLGLLYALNTLGGVAGCLAAGFLMVEMLGLSATTWAAAAGNIGVAGIALLLARREIGTPAAAVTGPGPAPRSATDRVSLLLAMGAVFLGGFAALVLEVVWTRTLLLVFGSTAYSFSAMLAVFLFGIGAGSLLMTPFADRLRRPWLVMGLLQGGIGLFVLLSAHAIDTLPRVYLDLVSAWGLTYDVDLIVKFVLSAALMLVPTLLSGAVWPVAVRLVRPRQERLGSEVGRLYASNTVGSILGSLAGAFVLLPLLGMQMSLASVSLVLAAFGALIALRDAAPLRSRVTVALALVVLAAGLSVTMQPWNRRLLTAGTYFMPRFYLDDDGRSLLDERLAESRLLFYAEGVTTTPSVSMLGDINKAFFNDGKIEGSTALDGMRLQRLLGQLPLLLHPGEPRIALNIGLGSGITVGAMGVHPLDTLDCAEIEPVVVGAARVFDDETFHILEHPALNMIYNDGRNHLMLTRKEYDAISSAPFAPLVGGAASLYTREHFQLVRDHLAPGGMTAQFLPLYQLSPVDFLSIMKTFAEVFPDATVWYTGVETVLVGSDGPQEFDFETLARRMSDPAIGRSLRDIGFDGPMRLLATYCFKVGDVAGDFEGIPLNTDDKPRIEFTAPRSHLTNTVKENLPWLLERRRSPEAMIRWPESWEPDDPRRGQLLDRLRKGLEVQRLGIEGRLDVLAGDLPAGIAKFEQALAIDPSDPYARDLAARDLVRLADRQAAAGDIARAAETYERALSWKPDQFVALYNLAKLSYENGSLPRAKDLTRRGLELAPDSPSLNYRMGLLLFNEGRLEGAQKHLRAALDSNPRYPEPLMVLGDIEQMRGDGEQAGLFYQQAILLGKRDAEAHAALAQALLSQGLVEKADAQIATALELTPGDPEATFVRARVRLAEGRRDAAARDLGAAVQAGGDVYRQRALSDPDLKQLLN